MEWNGFCRQVLVAFAAGDVTLLERLIESPGRQEELRVLERALAITPPVPMRMARQRPPPVVFGCGCPLGVLQWIYSPRRAVQMPATLAHLAFPILRIAAMHPLFNELIDTLFTWPPYWDVVSEELHQAILDTLLCKAGRITRRDFTSHLIAHGGQVNPEEGSSPVETSISCGRSNALLLLIENGAFVVGCNHLIQAFRETTTRVLMEYSANTDYLGMSVLMHAVQTCKLSLIRGILDGGCVDLDKRDAHGKTALMHAANCVSNAAKSITCVQWLLEAGADVTLRNHQGFSALEYAVGRCSEIVEQLLRAGADPNEVHRSRRWRKRLKNVNERCSLDLELLLEYGANPYQLDEENKSMYTRLRRTRQGAAFIRTHRYYFQIPAEATGRPRMRLVRVTQAPLGGYDTLELRPVLPPELIRQIRHEDASGIMIHEVSASQRANVA